MATTVRTPISRTTRIASVVACVIVMAVLFVDLRSHPQFGPPIVAGLSLGLVGIAAGAVLGSVIVWRRWRRDAGDVRVPPTG